MLQPGSTIEVPQRIMDMQTETRTGMRAGAPMGTQNGMRAGTPMGTQNGMQSGMQTMSQEGTEEAKEVSGIIEPEEEY